MEENKEKDSTAPVLPSKEVGKKTGFDFNAYSLVFEVGYTVAIPLVLFALVGRYTDRMFDTGPWLLLLGIVVSIFVSSFLVYRKVSKILY